MYERLAKLEELLRDASGKIDELSRRVWDLEKRRDVPIHAISVLASSLSKHDLIDINLLQAHAKTRAETVLEICDDPRATAQIKEECQALAAGLIACFSIGAAGEPAAAPKLTLLPGGKSGSGSNDAS